MSSELNPPGEIKLRVAQTIFNHIDGIAIGSTVCALRKLNLFKILEKATHPLDLGQLSRSLGCREGYFHVALRLLAHQGFVKLFKDMNSGQTDVSLTEDGRAWLDFLEYYEQIPRLSEMAAYIRERCHARADHHQKTGFSTPSVPSGDKSPEIAKRVTDHVFGEITAVMMTELFLGLENDVLRLSDDGRLAYGEMDDLGLCPQFVIDILRFVGWGGSHTDGLYLNNPGSLALKWAPQYFYPVSYLTTFRNVKNLLIGRGEILASNDLAGVEAHVDRLLDIKFSGIVYENMCRRQLRGIVLPLFDRLPLQEQPIGIVDTGSGDGTTLVDLFTAVREKTLRGRNLESFPLWIIGAEYSAPAMESTKQALEKAGIPNALVIHGDIGDPEKLARELTKIGVDPFNMLHINKSVIHNRVYRIPRDIKRLQDWKPLSRNPFVARDGSLISSEEMECNLVEFFEDWKSLTQRHGMVVMEAHTVDPELVNRCPGRNIVTCMDATHGYSNQYLMEYDSFMRAVMEACYEIRKSEVAPSSSLGRPTLSINHFFPRKP